MAIGKPLHLRLFIEGIEIPVVSAQVSIGINAPSAAAIQVIPVDPGFVMYPRSMVHLFFLDRTARTSTGELLKDYRLLFAGEFVALSYQQSPQSRGLILQCVDFSSYWDSAHATTLEYGNGSAFTNVGGLWTANTALFDDIINQHANRLMGWLQQKPSTPGLNTVNGLAGGIIKVLESIGGVPNVQQGVNPFFTVAELRCRILAQITAEENDDTAAKLLRNQVFDEWVRQGLQNIGPQVTFRDLMKLLFQYIYYEMVPNPAAKFEPAKQGKTTWDRKSYASLQKTVEGAAAKKSLERIAANMATNIGQDQLVSDGVWQDYLTNKNTELVKVKSDLAQLTAENKLAADQVRKVTDKLDQAIAKMGSLMSIKSMTTWSVLTPVLVLVNQANSALTAANAAEYKSVAVATSTGVTDRLHTQIIRPDCWFAPPPACNVVFPEQYVSLSYERNYMGEVTRVLIQLYNTLVGQERLLAQRILAPNNTYLSKLLTRKVDDDRTYRILMDHELHTGVIPREEWLPNTAAVSKATADPKKTGIANLRLSWAERIALFQFYKYRFANRSAAVGCRFTPNLVCGFPAVVIRAPYLPDANALNAVDPSKRGQYAIDHAIEFGAATHLLGMVGTVSHNVTQDGGMTHFTIHHVRHHNGSDDEFLAIAKSARSLTKNLDKVYNFDQIMRLEDGREKSESIAFLVGLTPQVDVQGSTLPPLSQVSATSVGGQTATRESSLEATQPPPLTTLASDKGVSFLTPAPPGKVTRGSPMPNKVGTVLRVVVTDAALVEYEGSKAFKEVKVTFTTDVQVENDVPTEEILRPASWFSEKYSNQRIGAEIYQPFFGCNSVVDELMTLSGDTTVEDESSVVTTSPGPSSSDSLVNFVEQMRVNADRKLLHNIERSVDLIAYTYGRMKTNNLSVEDFIQQYTRREIATMRQILGDENLQFDISPNGKATPKQVDLGDGMVGTPQVGFFSQAVHEQLVMSGIKLAGLVDDLTLQLPRTGDSGAPSTIPGKYDVRQQKRERVMDYYNALMKTRAFHG